MWLKDLIVINYKSCKNIAVSFSKDEPNVLIGINDCGKSSLLKAIGLLLSAKPTYNFIGEDKKKSDLSNSRVSSNEFGEILNDLKLPSFPYDENQTIIIGRLLLEDEDKEPSKIESYSSHFQWICDNLENNDIWLMRVFDTAMQTAKDYILTKDSSEDSKPIKLYTDSAKNLKERVSSLGISKKEIDNENQLGRFKNIELVNAIYKKYTLQGMWVDYSIKDEKNLFPEFAYLDWNVSMEALQQVAKSAINNKITLYTDEVNRVAKQESVKAQLVIDSELENFTKQFAVDLPNIQAFKSNIIFSLESRLTDILINKKNTHGDIHLDSQGEGIKRQIWFALIKWTALSTLSDTVLGKKFIWCFDEPETHLYPGAQREFFQIIKRVSSKNIQSLISTHSTVFIDKAHYSNIYKFELENGYSISSSCSSTLDVFEALQIRNSDFLFYDKFLVVEGDTEEALIPHLFKLYTNSSLSALGIQIINLGGKDKRKDNHSLLRNLLKDFNKDNEGVVYIFDNDIKSELTTSELTNPNYCLIGKQDIEDSIASEIWYNIILERFNSSGICLSIVEIDQIKSEIPDGSTKINGNQKFYPKLKSALKKKLLPDNFYLVDDNLPSKGKLSGETLCSYIVDKAFIDDNITRAFKLLLD